MAIENPGSFDFIFLDAGDKTVYVDLLNCCIDALRIGGFLIADNTLCGNSVVVKKARSHETIARTVTIRKFNELVFSEKRLDSSIVPIITDDYPPYAFTVAI